MFHPQLQPIWSPIISSTQLSSPLKQIEFVGTSIGDIVNALKNAGIFNDTLIIITA